VFNEPTNVNIKYLKINTGNDLCVEDAIWGTTRGWELTGEMYVISSLSRIANGAAEWELGRESGMRKMLRSTAKFW
jgi:hypothetical protein